MKAFIFFLIFIHPLSSMGTVRKKILIPNEKLPVEMKFLVQSLQMSELSAQERSQLNLSIIKMDQVLDRLSKEEIFFIVKTETYKVILKNKPQITINNKSYDRSILDNFSTYINSHTLSPFSRWFLLSLKSDLADILESSLFSTWKIRKKYNSELSSKLLRLEKKLELLLPWYEFMTLTESKNFDSEIKHIMLKTINRISLYILQLVQYSQEAPLELSPLRPKFSFFHEKEFDFDAKEEVQERTLEKIVDSVLKNKTPKPLPTPVNDWLPRADGDMPMSARVYPTPDPNYKRPDALPKPVDDWFDDL